MSAKRHRPAVASSTPLAPGDVLADKYRIEGVIGKGGMGVIYAGTNVQLDQRVAVKVLAASADDETVARFTREARTLAKLQDEHVSRVIDLGTSDLHGPFMVLELLEGEDFADLLERVGPLAIDEAVGYALQACEAVA
ncbi:MAG TPA: protein kinase, partial [Polyangiaceae bacterium]